MHWLAEVLRPKLQQLHTQAEEVSRYICAFYPGRNSLLDRSLESLGMERATTAAASRRLLQNMHSRMLQDKQGLGLAISTAQQLLQL